MARAAHAGGRDPADLRLVAVSKGQPAAAIRALHAAGQRDFGENYLQEALGNIAVLEGAAGLCWHYIGAIQSNKTAAIARHFAWVQSVERGKIARRLAAQRPPDYPPLNLCIQVNMDGEPGKAGVEPAGVAELAALIAELPRVRLRGLMFIPRPAADMAGQVRGCQRAAALFAELRAQYPAVDTLSLGMSADLEAAVQAGSSMLRIGTALFGARSG